MTMPPGTQVSIAAAASPNALPSATGTFFVVGESGSGPVGTPIPVTNLAEYAETFGSRTETAVSQTLYDAVDTFFQEGGQLAWISRVFASGAVGTDTAAYTLVDQAVSPLATLKVSAIGPGTYGNAITVQVTVSGSTFTLIINAPGFAEETSPPLTSPAGAVVWAEQFSDIITLTNLSSVTSPPTNNPAVRAATNLTGGVDQTSPADADWTNALAVFVSDLGIGQVAAPGASDENQFNALINHALAYNRFALLDALDAQSASELEATAAAIQAANADASYAILLTPYVEYPGLPTNTQTPPFTRDIPPSGAIAGVMARLAAQGNNADVAAAGPNGYLTHAVGVTTTYADSDRGVLEPDGVAVIRNYRGNVQLYGYTTLAQNPAWTDAGNVRLRMQIVDGVRQIGDSYVFADIDAQGHTAAAFGGQITAYLNQLWLQNALYGATAAEAFFVNVGSSINTPVTASERELLASVGVRMSPTAEFVIIGVTKYPVSVTLPS